MKVKRSKASNKVKSRVFKNEFRSSKSVEHHTLAASIKNSKLVEVSNI